jgi:hypothetical protein
VAEPAVLEAAVELAAPPQPVRTPAQSARAVRAAAVLWRVRFLMCELPFLFETLRR